MFPAATALDNCLVAVGAFHDEMTSSIYAINLEHADKVKAIGAPSAMTFKHEAAAQVINGCLYVVGFGNGRNETWKWDGKDEWEKFGGLLTNGVQRHCLATHESMLYLIGGFTRTQQVLRDIQVLDTSHTVNTWKDHGRLKFGVYSSSCVVFEGRIYVFGGNTTKEYAATDEVLVYDLNTKQCSFEGRKLPKMCGITRAVLHGTRVIFFASDACYTLNLKDNKPWEERRGFWVPRRRD